MAATIAAELVRRYAVTLLDAAQEAGVGDAVDRDLRGLAATLHDSPELVAFIEDRLLAGERAAEALTRIFGDKVDGLTLNFLRLVASRRRTHVLAAIVDAALAILDERAGVGTAEVRSATPLTAAQIEALQERLSGYTGRQVRVHAEIDESLRGGLVARVGDTVFDGSIETQLQRLRERLTSA